MSLEGTAIILIAHCRLEKLSHKKMKKKKPNQSQKWKNKRCKKCLPPFLRSDETIFSVRNSNVWLKGNDSFELSQNNTSSDPKKSRILFKNL